VASVTPVKRARGYAWRVQARDDQGKMKQETFYGDDAQQVADAAATFGRLVDRVGITEAARIRDQRDGALPKAITLAEWIDRYLDKETGILAGVTDGTRKGYRVAADAYFLPRLGELPISQIDVEDISRWIVWMEQQPSPRRKGETLAGKTVKNHHATLSAILSAAAGRGLRTGNPARGAKMTRTRRKRMTVLTQSEFAVLLSFVREEHQPFIMWLAGTGMRWGEATALTWGDVDRDANPLHALVHIDKAWQKTEGGPMVLGPPKSDAGERTISVPHELVAQLGKPRRGDALVFPNGAGKPLWSGSFWPRIWQPAVAAANDDELCTAAGLTPIGKKPTIHDMRHCHASWLIHAGRPLPYIQARLGHEKITTTVDTYGHLLPDAQQGDAEAVALMMAMVLPQAEDEAPQIEA
jgi:integrase